MFDLKKILDDAKKTFEQWDKYSQISEVTIIRDVLGKLSFVLDMQQLINTADKEAIQTELEKKLGKYYQGHFYIKQDSNSDLINRMIDSIEHDRWKYDCEGLVKWYLLERAIAKKAWVECREIENSVWLYEDAVAGKKPRVVTFYSFKGGMGRTTAAAATALALASRGYKILMIDADIEAPGLATFFFEEETIEQGIIDYFLEAENTKDNEEIDMSSMILQVTDPMLMNGLSENGQIFVIPAGKVDSDYLQKLARIDFQDTKPGQMKKVIIRLLEEAIANIARVCSIDYIFFDSRAGFHDMGGIVTTQIPHGVVLLCKDSKQSWQGTKEVLRSISETQTEKPLVTIVDSACGMEGIISAEEKRAFEEQAYMMFCDVYYDSEVQPAPNAIDEAHSPIYVPYQVALSKDIQLYTDGTINSNERVEQLKARMLGECYQKIADRVELWFNNNEGRKGK